MFVANIRYCCIGYILAEVSQFLNLLFLLPVVVFAVISVMLNKLTKKEIAKILILLLFSALLFINTNQIAILVTTVTLVSMKDISIDKILKLDMISKIIVVIIVAIMMVLGIVPDTERVEFLLGFKLVAHSLGFRSVNTLGLIVLITLIDYAYISKQRITNLKLLFILFIGSAFSIISSSRTLFVGHILLVILLFIYFNVKKYRIPFWALFIVSVPFVLFSFFYNELPFVKSMDAFMSGRIWLGYAYFQLYPIRFLGNTIHYGYERFNGIPITLDNFYVRAIVNFGLLFCVVYFYSFISKFISNNKQSNLTNNIQNILIFVVFVCSVAESNFYNIFFNPALFFLVPLIFEMSDNGKPIPVID